MTDSYFAHLLAGIDYQIEKGKLWDHPLFWSSVSSAKMSWHVLPSSTTCFCSTTHKNKASLIFVVWGSISSQVGVLRLWGAAAKKEMSWKTQHKVKSVTCLSGHSESGFKLWRITPFGGGSSNVLTGTAPPLAGTFRVLIALTHDNTFHSNWMYWRQQQTDSDREQIGSLSLFVCSCVCHYVCDFSESSKL